ncbi:MAG: hypothetical protein LBI79_04615 [Nitrososphaerota archaeon]|jgi:tRNA A37 methylthiotransferase MiaB|nr:hypothetical protein [Nitrososphaerota archaeon]
MTLTNGVLGFPEETKQTANQTIRFVQQLNPEYVGFYLSTPLLSMNT